MVSGRDQSIKQMEGRAKAMLKRGLQPSYVAKATGLNLMWIEQQAMKYGKRPLTVEGVKNAK
jgi:hypothetical protein